MAHSLRLAAFAGGPLKSRQRCTLGPLVKLALDGRRDPRPSRVRLASTSIQTVALGWLVAKAPKITALLAALGQGLAAKAPQGACQTTLTAPGFGRPAKRLPA